MQYIIHININLLKNNLTMTGTTYKDIMQADPATSLLLY